MPPAVEFGWFRDAPGWPLWPAAAVVTWAVMAACLVWLWRKLENARRGVRGERVAERLRLHATLEGMLDPLVILEPVRDAAGQVVDFIAIDANPAACGWLELRRDRLVGARLRTWLPEVESSGLLNILGVLVDTGRPLVLDNFPFLRHGTVLRRLDVRGNRGAGWISLVWRDVTERHDAIEKLAASEERFRLLAENTLDVVALISAHDKVLWVSPAMKPVLGWEAAECVGRDAEALLAEAGSQPHYRAMKARVLAGQGAVTRVRLRDARGGLHWAEIHASPVRNPEGRIDGMVSLTRIVDAEVESQQALDRRARTDDLTQLLNRQEFLDRLDELVRRGAADVAVLWCDIDRFKAINDTHGHAAGDAVLQELAERIRGCLRTSDDMAARIGGDEFMVVRHGVHGSEDAARVAEEVRRRAADPISVGETPIQATVSIGVTLLGAKEPVDAILARADDAMYRAKEQGRNRVVVAVGAAALRAAS